MKILPIIMSMLLLSACTNLEIQSPFQLVKNKQAAAGFVLPDKPSECLISAIKSFNSDLKKSSGVELPILKVPAKDLNNIVFNITPCGLMDDDKFDISFPAHETMQINASPRSVKWALNHILEKFVGVRWLFPGEHGTHWPQKSCVSIQRKTISQKASFPLQRNLSYPVENWQIHLNGKDALKFNHELTVWAFPLKKYGPDQSWPPEIMPVIRGKKKTKVNLKKARGHWQPCYSNPKTVKVAVENICEYLKKNPKTKSLSLSVNDGGSFCECESCKKAQGGKKNSLGLPDYSNLYFNWVNKVVEKVSAKYPNVYFGCLAYREVMAPPSFKLHPKIVPFICFDIYTCLDPETKEKRFEIIKKWSKKARQWGHWDYSYTLPSMLLPRVYFDLQKEIMCKTREYGARAMFVEAYPTAHDPSKYLYLKLMWNVNANVDKLLDDWCVACAGKKAAPFLKQYFRSWNDFWNSEDIKKSPWFVRGKNSIYMRYGPEDYFLGLKPGSLAKFRKMLEQALDMSETSEQKARIKIIMQDFEFYELTARAYNAEKISCHGSLDTSRQAVELIRDLPNALLFAEKRKEMIENMPKALSRRYKARAYQDFSDFISEKLNLSALFIDKQQVKNAVVELAGDQKLPTRLRVQAKMMLRLAEDKPVKNIFSYSRKNLSFGGKGSSEVAFRNKPSNEIFINKDRFVLSHRQSVQPGKTYMFSSRIFISEKTENGIVQLWLIPHNSKTGKDLKYKRAPYPSFKLIPGKWNMICSTLSAPKLADTIIIYLVCYGLNGKTIYLADIKLAAINEEYLSDSTKKKHKEY